MTKEFEAIRDDKLRIGLLGLKRLFEANAKKMTKDEIIAFDFTFMNITKALTELQAIKEAKPSEALRCLENIGNYDNWSEFSSCVAQEFPKEYNTIKQALLKAEKLEIENKFIKDALNTLIKIDDSDISHLKIKAIPQNVAANQDVIKLLKEIMK